MFPQAVDICLLSVNLISTKKRLKMLLVIALNFLLSFPDSGCSKVQFFMSGERTHHLTNSACSGAITEG